MITIHSQKEFSRILARERIRADRAGHVFSIVILEMLNLHEYKHNVPALSFLLRKRLRCCDEIGWYDKLQIGIMLPDTDSKGAHILARNICRDIVPQELSPQYEILTYPEHWFNGKNGDGHADIAARRAEEPEGPDAGSGHTKLLKAAETIAPERLPPWKRAVDIIGTLLCLLLLFPVMLLIAVYIKSVSPGPVFFRQQRLGFMGKQFCCWKFRTMKVNADTSCHKDYYRALISSGRTLNKLDDTDNRIIPMGTVLRKTGLDELPQLFNVLCGDMSLVGPRPCIPYEAQNYKLWQCRRFDALPGLTGLWQVSGKNRTTFTEMMRYDIRYATEKSLSLDFMIFFKTIPAIIDQVMDKNLGVKNGRAH